MMIQGTGNRFMLHLLPARMATIPLTRMDAHLTVTTVPLGSRMESSSAPGRGAGADVIGATGMVDGAATAVGAVTMGATATTAAVAIPVDAATVAAGTDIRAAAGITEATPSMAADVASRAGDTITAEAETGASVAVRMAVADAPSVAGGAPTEVEDIPLAAVATVEGEATRSGVVDTAVEAVMVADTGK